MGHKRLLKDLRVKRWYDDLSRGSQMTAQVYLRRLGLFCRKWRTSPVGLMSKQPHEIHENLDASGYAGSQGQSIAKAVKSWLSFNNITLRERKIKFTDPEDTPTLRQEKAPEPNELRKAFEHASTRTRAAIQGCQQGG
jgi:hypothetical protein